MRPATATRIVSGFALSAVMIWMHSGVGLTRKNRLALLTELTTGSVAECDFQDRDIDRGPGGAWQAERQSRASDVLKLSSRQIPPADYRAGRM